MHTYIHTYIHAYTQKYTPLALKCKSSPNLVTTIIYSAVLFYLYCMFPVLAVSVVRPDRTHL